MNYFLNRFTLIVIAVFIFLMVLTFNEVGKFADQVVNSKLAYKTGLFDEQHGLYKTQERCEEKTNYICDYKQCTDIPEGKTVAEICGANFRPGWIATAVPITPFYRNLRTMRLTVLQKPIVTSYDINADAGTMNHIIATANGTPISQTQPVPSDRLVSLKNKMILLDFIHDRSLSAKPEPVPSGTALYSFYLLSQDMYTTSTQPAVEERSLSCLEAECSHGVNSILTDIKSLWNEISVP